MRIQLARLFVLLLLLCACLSSQVSAADFLDRMMSPGDLHKKHEKLAENCKNCHVAFDKKAQSRRCRDCHKDIDRQILSSKGYHGLDPMVRSSSCSRCHSEHKGRTAALVAFDRENFNHNFTNYPLKGGHVRVSCSSCHAAGVKFSKAPVECVQCHLADDRHKGQLGGKCANCHVEASWKSVRFDHQSTKFPLTGAHAKVQCSTCHADQRYRGVPKDCFSCHQIDDAHKGSNGKLCASCHVTSSWKTVSFDHNRQTRFPLTGGHVGLKCASCHKGEGRPQRLEMSCISCHRADDKHKGANGTTCERCHTASSWKKTSFDHDTQTRFPLKGSHGRLQCAACHKAGVTVQKPATDCVSCHAKDDVHKGQQGKNCARCHNEKAWDAKVKFDHGLTRFPLVGLHASVSCERCHLTAAYRDTSRECVACHVKDDRHKQTLGPSCGDCHNPNGWRFWQFDHDTQTSFGLTGAHSGLVCSACHTEKTNGKARARSTCISCHRADDKHRGEFGERCEACHTTQSFKGLRQ